MYWGYKAYRYCLTIIVVFGSLLLRSQCDQCDLETDNDPDFCYVNENFPELCAAFVDKDEAFFLKGKKK